MTWQTGRIRPVLLAAFAIVAAIAFGLAVLLLRPPGPAAFVEYEMSEPMDTPTALSAAADGSIWFTIDMASAVGRIRDSRVERIQQACPEPRADRYRRRRRWRGMVPLMSRPGRSRMSAQEARSRRRHRNPCRASRPGRRRSRRVDLVRQIELSEHHKARPWHDDAPPYGWPEGSCSVAVAADGTAWASLQAGNALVRIAPGEAPAILELPDPGAVPTDVAVGPMAASQVSWPFVPTGSAATARAGSRASTCRAPMPACRGSPWRRTAPLVGMLRTASLGRWRDGRIDILPLPRGRCWPYSIAVDGVGNVWYADLTGHVGMLPAAAAR